MNGGIVPLSLLSVTVGLMLAFVALPRATVAMVAFAAAALVAFSMPFDLPPDAIFTGLWLSMVAAAILVYLPVSRWSVAVLPICLNAGFWSGVYAGLTGGRAAFLVAILMLCIAIPARWLARGKFTIALKVVASWMIAIASLSLFVTLIPTPGYKPDHME